MKAIQWSEEKLPRSYSLSLVIPAYNEANRILPTLESLDRFLKNHCHHLIVKHPVEVVIVDDGSKDKMVEILKAAIPQFQRFQTTLLSLPENKGKGAAIRAGILKSRNSWILIADADGSTAWEDLNDFLESIVKDESITAIYGSRGIQDATIAGRGFVRQLGAWAINRWICTVAGIQMKDTQCGFKLIEGNVAKNFADWGTQDRFSWDIELLVFLKNFNLKVKEQAVRWTHKEGSKLRPFQDGLRLLLDCIEISRNSKKFRRSKTRFVA